MNKKKRLLSVAVVALAASVVWLLRAGGESQAPQSWIVDAAVAFNRDAIMSAPHGAPTPAHAAAGRRGDAQRAAHAGQQLRIQRRFSEAEAAFRQAVEADPGDADAWADLADSAAAAAGGDLNAGRTAIERALALDPRHVKALWLRASLELQERRYADAAASWRELHPLVAPQSADARVIQANIAEAEALAGASPGQGG